MEPTSLVQNSSSSFSEDRDRMQNALEAAGIGTWEVRLDTHILSWDDLCKQLFGLGKDSTVTYNEAIKCIHPDDLESVTQAVSNALEGKDGGKYDMRYRTISAEDGKLRWVHFSGQAKFNNAGEAVYFGGIARDISGVVKTEHNLAETVDLLQTVLDSSFAGFSVLSSVRNAEGTIIDFKYRLVNRKTEQLNKQEDLVGKLFSSVHPAAWNSALFDDFVRVIERGDFIEKDRHYEMEGRDYWYTTLAVKLGDGLVFSFHDITESVVAQQQLQASEAKIRSVIEAAPAGMGLFVGRDLVVEIPNKAFTEIVGKGPGIAGKPLREVMPELDNQPFLQMLDDVYTSGKMFQSFGTQVNIVQNGQMTACYYNITYTPLFNANGEVYAILDIAIDVTEQICARQRLEESESKLRSLVAAAPAAIAVFTGRDLLIETFNQTFIDIAGKGADIGGKPLREVLPELEDQPFLRILDEVFTSGKQFQSYGTAADLVRDGTTHRNYYNITFTPLLNAQGAVYAILDISIDVTESVHARQELEESELFSRTIFEYSPVGKIILTGPEMTIKTVNEKMLEILGRDNSIVGLPFMDAVPELKETPIMERLLNVRNSMELFSQPEEKIDLVRFGVPYTGYFSYIFKALRNKAGTTYGIICTASEVTGQVLARQKVEIAETTLRGAIELAKLGTWEIDLRTGRLDYSDRLRSWMGVGADETVTRESAYQSIRKEDRPRLKEELAKAISGGPDAASDIEYEFGTNAGGPMRILHARGRTFFNDMGEAYKIGGTVQDITAQRTLQTDLEQEVVRRTQELESVNMEVATANKELEEANKSLVASNEELAQYAYVASHDLQEPLRKIRFFSNLLGNTDELSNESKPVIHKIEAATERMTLLIRDLLDFSRLLKSDKLMRPVPLQDILTAVINDFELTIEEKSARINVGILPEIEGVSLQMNQLFYNLVGNALKFSHPEVPPEITVTATLIPENEVKKYIPQPLSFSPYFQISVADNGIGFDARYQDQIFEVFKRLHGRNVYPGSGIGLALCRRIATNHKGLLRAESEPGKGATFTLILPAKQHDFEPTLPEDFRWTD